MLSSLVFLHSVCLLRFSENESETDSMGERIEIYGESVFIVCKMRWHKSSPVLLLPRLLLLLLLLCWHCERHLCDGSENEFMCRVSAPPTPQWCVRWQRTFSPLHSSSQAHKLDWTMYTIVLRLPHHSLSYFFLVALLVRSWNFIYLMCPFQKSQTPNEKCPKNARYIATNKWTTKHRTENHSHSVWMSVVSLCNGSFYTIYMLRCSSQNKYF